MNAASYILLVNRDKRYLQTVSESLTVDGYPVLAVTTLKGALELLAGNKVSIIISDCELEDANGYDFLAFLKKNPVFKVIPFLFLVSSRFVVDSLDEEVSKILKAFDLGAVDFIVDTMDEEISMLLTKRFKKILPANAIEKKQTAESVPEPPQAAVPGLEDRRDSQRIAPGQVVIAEISRDGVLWMPARITNINEQGLMIETSLLGRLGMELYVKILLPGGKDIVAISHIKHIAINKGSSSAEIGVEIDESVEWIKIYNYVAKLMGLVKKPSDTDRISPEKAGLQIAGDKKQYIYVDPLLGAPDDSQSARSLEIKFYRSLIGKQLGNYKVVSFIGAGSMAGVFKGSDCPAGTQCRSEGHIVQSFRDPIIPGNVHQRGPDGLKTFAPQYRADLSHRSARRSVLLRDGTDQWRHSGGVHQGQKQTEYSENPGTSYYRVPDARFRHQAEYCASGHQARQYYD